MKINWRRGAHQIHAMVVVVLIVGLVALTGYGINLRLSLRNKAATSSPQPYGQTGNWNLIFADEFNGTSLDLTKWRPNWLGSTDTSITPPINSAETGCYDPAQVTEANGELDFTAIAKSCLNKYNFASGMIESNGKFNFTYGYMEARMWTPAGTGVWPAFWTDGQNWPTTGEIDVLEAYGTDTSTYHFHYAGCGGDCNPGGETVVAGATSGWHTYAADWEPGVITWYYDGVQVWQYTTGITSDPMYLIANLGLNSTTPTVPSTLKIDYIRVWQKGTATPTPTPIVTPTPTPTPVPPSGSGISFRSAAAANNGSGKSSLTINTPAGVVGGDVMVAQVTVRGGSTTITAPSGWTLIRRDNTGSSVGNALYYKVASASEPTSYNWVFNGSKRASGGIADYAGVSTTSPIDASSGRYNDSTSTITANSITTTSTGDQLLFFTGITTNTTVSWPSGMAQKYLAVDTGNTTSAMADQALSSSGATGNRVAIEGTNNSNLAELVALRPGVVVTLTPTPTPVVSTPTPTPVVTPTPTPAPTPTPSSSGITLKSTSGANNGSRATTLNIQTPAGVTSGDVMVAQVTVEGATTTIAPPSGWNLIRRDNTGSSIGNALYSRVSTGSEPTSYTFTFGTSQAASGWIADYTGVNNSSPIDVTSGQYNDSTSVITAPSVTTTAANDRLLFIVAVTTNTTVTPPSGFNPQVIATDTGNTTSYLADKILTSAGATGNQIGTEGASNSNIAELVALRAQ